MALFCACLALMVISPLSSPALAQPALIAGAALTELQGPERAAALAKVSAALQNTQQLQGGFLQINPDGGVAKGKFYLRRPGKIRFEYDPPAKILVVADGSTIAIQDNRLKTFNRAPLRTTPLYFFLKSNVDLSKDAKVIRVAKQADTIAVTLQDRTGQSDGQLTLLFTSQSYELRQWIVEDGTGAVTRVALNNLQRPGSLDPKLFVLQPKQQPLQR